jgi:hypothetical protein
MPTVQVAGNVQDVRGRHFRKLAKSRQAEAPRVGGNDAAPLRDELRLHTGEPSEYLIAADSIEGGQPVINQNRKPHHRLQGSEQGREMGK